VFVNWEQVHCSIWKRLMKIILRILLNTCAIITCWADFVLLIIWDQVGPVWEVDPVPRADGQGGQILPVWLLV